MSSYGGREGGGVWNFYDPKILETRCPSFSLTLSHGNLYIFYELAISYDLTRTILYDLSKPQ